MKNNIGNILYFIGKILLLWRVNYVIYCYEKRIHHLAIYHARNCVFETYFELFL